MGFPKRMTIQSHTINVVSRYAETDQGGVIHHSVYPVWFEIGRTELLRVNGLAYKELEEAGCVLCRCRVAHKISSACQIRRETTIGNELLGSD